MIYHVFTDGSCNNNKDKNPYKAGACWFVILDNKWRLIYENGYGGLNSSSAREEMNGIIHALKFIHEIEDVEKGRVNLYTDSQFIVNSINKGWLRSWINNNTLTGRVNEDLWLQMLPLLKPFIEFRHVNGHQKNNTVYAKWNNRCDIMANKKRLEFIGLGIDNFFNKSI